MIFFRHGIPLARHIMVSRRSLGTTAGGGFIQIEKSVQEALDKKKPVVALESTIIAHGMPYPQNLELAQKVESILRSKGVVPATIAVKDGICRVGLSSEELEDLAKAGEESRASKTSTRDLPILLSSNKMSPGENEKGHHVWGATTVASTMKLAHAAGIATFVTGGIGGVHRNGHVSMDISADLTELSRTPVVVVSAGIKSILDIERTLEVLETNSVPTIGWQTDEFPAFFSPHSGVSSPARMDYADEVASAYWAARALNMPQGMMVAVPNYDPAGSNVERAIQDALTKAEEMNIHGQAVTPFVLKNVAEETEGDSLRSNMALVQQNAEVGAEIAVAIASDRFSSDYRHQVTTNSFSRDTSSTFAGSAKNLGILEHAGEMRMSPLSKSQPVRSEVLQKASFLLMDGHVSIDKSAQTAAKRALKEGVDVIFIPAGVNSAIEASRQDDFLSSLKYAITDVEELLAIGDGWTDSFEDLELAKNEKSLATVKAAASQTLENMHPDSAHLLVTLGERGVLLSSRKGQSKPTFYHSPIRNKVEIIKWAAAGDCLCGAFLHALLDGKSEEDATLLGLEAVDSLISFGQLVSPLLSQFQAKKV